MHLDFFERLVNKSKHIKKALAILLVLFGNWLNQNTSFGLFANRSRLN